MKTTIQTEACLIDHRVLLLASEPGLTTVARILEQKLELVVTIAIDCRSCQELLRGQQFGLLLVENAFSIEQPTAIDSLCELAGHALVLDLNFGVSNAARIVGQVRSALAHRRLEQKRLRRIVMHALREEVIAALSGLLLQTQVILSRAEGDISPSLEHNVRIIESLCEQLRA